MHLCIRHFGNFRGTGSWLDRTLALLPMGGINGVFDATSVTLRGVPEGWLQSWEGSALDKARELVRDGWSANSDSAQSLLLDFCRRHNFRIHALLSAVPTFSHRQWVARFLAGSFGVARVHAHYQRPGLPRSEKRLCLFCLREGRGPTMMRPTSCLVVLAFFPCALDNSGIFAVFSQRILALMWSMVVSVVCYNFS